MDFAARDERTRAGRRTSPAAHRRPRRPAHRAGARRADGARPASQVEWFRKPLLKSPFKSNHRLHRKVCVVDGRIGFTGGVGIAAGVDAATPATRTSGATPTCACEGPAVDGLQSAFIQDWAETRPASSTTTDDEFPVQPQRGYVDRAGRARLGQPRLGRHAVGVPRDARLGSRAAAHRDGLLRARRRLPRHPVRGTGSAASRSTCCCPARTPTSGCRQLTSEGAVRAAGRLRRARLDVPAVDDAREGHDRRRRRQRRRLVELQPALARPRRGGRADRAGPRPHGDTRRPPRRRLRAQRRDRPHPLAQPVDARSECCETVVKPIRRWM